MIAGRQGRCLADLTELQFLQFVQVQKVRPQRGLLSQTRQISGQPKNATSTCIRRAKVVLVQRRCRGWRLWIDLPGAH